MMELVEVTKIYRTGRMAVEAVRGVSLSIAAGELVVIMGPSGSGKSTLMHLLGSLDTPTTGRVLFQGRDLQSLSDRERSVLRRTRIGFIFQFFNLLPTLTGAENVALPLLLGGQSRPRALAAAHAALERVGMGHRAHHFSEEMSGGEMQRVASANSKEVLQLLRSLPEAGRRSVVMVTHDPSAAAYGDRLIHIRDGRIASTEVLNGQDSSHPFPSPLVGEGQGGG
jgi:putative ABC transport system ATP-binding protein